MPTHEKAGSLGQVWSPVYPLVSPAGGEQLQLTIAVHTHRRGSIFASFY